MATDKSPQLDSPAGLPSEADNNHDLPDNSEGQAYSIFSKRDKILIVCLASLAGFFSPFTAFTYFPALQSIADDFAVSIELVNITVTVYLLVQGIVPLLLGDFSENSGRRPAYLLTFSIYCGASIGLALQRNYAALLVLRMVQSAGASGSIGLAYGVIGDIAAPHERGGYVGYVHIGFNCAPAVGPILGGVIADRAGWPWIFVFVAAASGLTLLLIGVFLKETARNVVGNGSIRPHGINVSLLQRLQRRRPKDAEDKGKHLAMRIPNIVAPLKLIFYKTTFPTLLSNAVFYMLFASLQATLAPLFQQIYGLSPLQAGLCYLAFGISCGVASVSRRAELY
jgi:multidrug resistance protein